MGALVSLGSVVSAADLEFERSLFDNFVEKYGTQYDSDVERAHRFNVFLENLHHVEVLNLQEPTAKYGITQFSDLSKEEFERLYLGRKKPANFANATTEWKPTCTACKRFPELAKYHYESLPSDFDWRDYGAVTDVKNQGQCGSCWTFGTTGDIGGVWFLDGNDLTSLSEQQLLSCDYGISAGNFGCNGGLQENAFEYVIDLGGIVSEETYPYRSYMGSITGNTHPPCQDSKVTSDQFAASISSWSQVSSSAAQEDDIMTALVNQGPVTIGINAENMESYTGGIADPTVCPAAGVDHAVLIVGYGTQLGTDYWTIKNSWGSSWGEDGYYRIVRGSNACGLATDVVHSTV